VKTARIFPPIATPFDHKGDLYRVKVQHNVEKWNKTPLAGYAVCGSTGESVFLTTERKNPDVGMGGGVRRFVEASDRGNGCRGSAGDRGPDQSGCGSGLQSRHGAHAALLQEPGEPLCDAQVLYFRAVADQARIPVMIYNWPQATGVDIMPEAVAMLSEHPNIIAIKESSGSLEKVMQMIRETQRRVSGADGKRAHSRPMFIGWMRGRGAGVRQRGSLRDNQHL